MASFNTSLKALYSTVDTSLSAVTTVADTAVKALNEGSSRLNEWSQRSELVREKTRSAEVRRAVDNKFLDIAEDLNKVRTKLANDSNLNSIFEELKAGIE